MASRVTNQNISPEVIRKPWRVMSPDAENEEKLKIKWNTLLVDSLFRFIITLLCLLCLATATLDLETNLIGMQNKYTRG